MIQSCITCHGGIIMPFVATSIVLSDAVKAILTEVSNSRTLPANLIERATILLYAAEGSSNKMISVKLGISQNVASKWRMRYAGQEAHLRNVEKQDPKKLEETVINLLKDAHRSGRPSTFTDSQLLKIYDIACMEPDKLGVELSHWSIVALADYISEHVVNISPAQLWRILARCAAMAKSRVGVSTSDGHSEQDGPPSAGRATPCKEDDPAHGGHPHEGRATPHKEGNPVQGEQPRTRRATPCREGSPAQGEQPRAGRAAPR